VQPNHAPNPRYDSPAFRLGFARLVTHYWSHAAWLEDGILLRNLGRLRDVPAVLIHGRLDLGTPLVTPWRLSQAWPGSALVVVDEAGHDAGHPGMSESIVAATDRFAT
jgi:proline iminopeptidase